MNAYLLRRKVRGVGDAAALEVLLATSDSVSEMFEDSPLFLAEFVIGHI